MKRILTFLTLAVVMLALPMSAVYASEPIHVSGTTGFDPTILTDAYAGAKQAGKNVILEVEIVDHWIGTITGDSDPSKASFVVRNWAGPPGEGGCPHPLGFCPDTQATAHMKLYFPTATVTVPDGIYTGSLTMELSILATGFELGGHWTILYGTDQLKNLHGHGTVTINSGGHSYEGQIHFDP